MREACGDRLTIVAPHPDDEVLGVGGVMRIAAGRGVTLRIVAVTDGEAAFGPSDEAARQALVGRRVRERARALVLLGIAERTEIVRLQLPDGAVEDHEESLAAELDGLLGPAVLTTWRHDGHPDHEATGRAVERAAAARGACLREFPVWALSRGHLTDDVVAAAHHVRLDAATRSAKRRAVHAFRSQLLPSPDGRPVVPASVVRDLCAADEVLIG